LAVFGFHFDTFYKAKRKLEAKENNEVYKESYVKWPAWYTRWGRTALILLAATGVCVRKDA
ncbi:MAG TPA: hypothetical protein VD996_01980, partial [Chitinophagaceae bacterium]|nr:hypothetical protein [Chitinophagaceae bacterium]